VATGRLSPILVGEVAQAANASETHIDASMVFIERVNLHHASRRGAFASDSCLDLAIVIENTNFPTPKFHASFGITDSTLLGVFAGPIRLHSRPFKTLPAASEWPNFNDRSALLHGIS
jgi:hypothetical protein